MYSIANIADRPELIPTSLELIQKTWDIPLPPTRGDRYVARILETFRRFLLVAIDDKTGELVGYTAALPFVGPARLDDLPEEGYDAVIEGALDARDRNLTPTMLGALVIGVSPDRRGEGLGEFLAKALCDLTYRSGYYDLVMPVRPGRKSMEPHTPMEEYIRKRREDGQLHDPWLRLHERLGAKIIKVCPRSMTMQAPLSEWVKFSGINFEKSGSYVVPGGLVPLEVDLQKPDAVMFEPNVWMHYDLRHRSPPPALHSTGLSS